MHDGYYKLKNLYRLLDILESTEIREHISAKIGVRTPLGVKLYSEYTTFKMIIETEINNILIEIAKGT